MGRGLQEPLGMLPGSSLRIHRPNRESDSPGSASPQL